MYPIPPPLPQEVKRLFAFSEPVTLSSLNGDPTRSVKMWEKLATRAIASFL